MKPGLGSKTHTDSLVHTFKHPLFVQSEIVHWLRQYVVFVRNFPALFVYVSTFMHSPLARHKSAAIPLVLLPPDGF